MPDDQSMQAFIANRSAIWRQLRPILEGISNEKCWYSEARDKVSYWEVDHYRPKKLYPWLAFDWKNFRLCGAKPNRKKTDEFPLEDEVSRATLAAPDTAREGAYCVVPGRSTFSVASNGSRLILAAVFDAACAVLAHSGRGLSASRRSAGRRGSLARIGAADDPPTAAPTCRWNVSPSNVRPRTTPSAAAACGASPCPP